MNGIVLPNLSRYEIMPNGAIKSKKNERYLTWEITSTGYARVGLIGDDGIKKHYYIHQLVAQAYLPNPSNWPQVNHKDENKLHNHFSNLEWCTQEYNNRYYRELHPEKIYNRLDIYGGQNAKAIVMCDAITHDPITYFASMIEAERQTRVNSSSIRHFIKHGNKKNNCRGYWWRYATEEEIDKYNLSYSS